MKRKPVSTSSSTAAKASTGPQSSNTDVSGRRWISMATGQAAGGADMSTAQGRLSRLARSARQGGGLASLHEQLHPESRASGAGAAHPSGIADPEILKHLTAQDIRDLRLVFDTFDTHGRGRLSELELRRAMKCLGFKVLA